MTTIYKQYTKSPGCPAPPPHNSVLLPGGKIPKKSLTQFGEEDLGWSWVVMKCLGEVGRDFLDSGHYWEACVCFEACVVDGDGDNSLSVRTDYAKSLFGMWGASCLAYEVGVKNLERARLLVESRSGMDREGVEFLLFERQLLEAAGRGAEAERRLSRGVARCGAGAYRDCLVMDLEILKLRLGSWRENKESDGPWFDALAAHGHLLGGRVVEAYAKLRRLQGRLKDNEFASSLKLYHALLSLVYTHVLGEYNVATSLLPLLVEYASHARMDRFGSQTQAFLFLVTAATHLPTGRIDAAITSAARGLQIADPTGPVHDALVSVSTQCDLWAGRVSHASSHVSPHDVTGRAILALHAQDLDSAVRLLGDARPKLDDFGHHLWIHARLRRYAEQSPVVESLDRIRSDHNPGLDPSIHTQLLRDLIQAQSSALEGGPTSLSPYRKRAAQHHCGVARPSQKQKISP